MKLQEFSISGTAYVEGIILLEAEKCRALPSSYRIRGGSKELLDHVGRGAVLAGEVEGRRIYLPLELGALLSLVDVVIAEPAADAVPGLEAA